MICHEFYSTSVSEVCFRASSDRYITYTGPGDLNKNTKIDASFAPLTSGQPNQTFVESKVTIEDIRDPGVEYLLHGQLIFMLLGMTSSACTLLSARFLKGQSNK